MKPNRIVMKVYGRYALFTDPMTKIGGEKSSLMIPSYETLKGIVSASYWKPSIDWVIESVKVLNPIRTERKGIRPIKYNGGNDLAYYTYLSDVAYIISAHFEFNKRRPDLEQDWNENKHYYVARRSLEKGGRRDIFLGARECPASIEPGDMSEPGYYDDKGTLSFGLMYHSLCYPNQNDEGNLYSRFWHPKMENGIIHFCRPEECEKIIFLRKGTKKELGNIPILGVDEEAQLLGYQEGGENE